MSLSGLINLTSFDFYFLVVDEFLDISVPELTNFYSISPQQLGVTLAEKNSGRLLEHPKVIDYINKNSLRTGHQPAIVPFKPSAKIDLICREHSWVLVSNPASLNRFLEDKIKFVSICSENNFPAIESIVLPFNEANYQKALTDFGSPLVLQTHFGWAGNSSHLSVGYSDVQNVIPENTLVKITPYLLGYSLINNCCIFQNQLLQSPVGLQYTGLSNLSTNPLATVGRQWPSMAPANIQNQVKSITESFGQYLISQNFHGFFGLDFFVSENKVYLLECNPRLTASFAFYTQLELAVKLTPLFYYHLAEFININYPLEPRFDNQNIIGSELTRKNGQGTTLKKLQQPIALSQTTSPISIDPQIISKLL